MYLYWSNIWKSLSLFREAHVKYQGIVPDRGRTANAGRADAEASFLGIVYYLSNER